MIALLDTSHDLAVASAELGCPTGQLFSPLNGFLPKDDMEVCGFDNGGLGAPDADAFEKKLERLSEIKSLCRFVACPDVVTIGPYGPVGDARRTLEVFEYWYPRICDWPVALVAQDGQEDLPIPWELISAIFIGGSTKWKLSHHAAAIIKSAKWMGKWVHAGRVNTPARFEYFEELGADSIDGTGLSQYSWMRKAIYEAATKPTLFNQEQPAPAEAEGLQEMDNVVA
jgi:hypothetical protein